MADLETGSADDSAGRILGRGLGRGPAPASFASGKR